MHTVDYQSWKREYGHVFTEGEDGLPFPGEVVQYYRLQLGWSRLDLANVLHVSRKTVDRMETRNEQLDSLTTRRNLIRALGISPLLLGLSGFSGMPEQAKASTTSPALIEQVRKDLPYLWDMYYTSQPEMQAIVANTQYLKYAMRDTRGKMLEQSCLALIGYYLLTVEAARRDRDYTLVFQSLREANTLAKELGNTDALAAVEMEYGASYFERGEIQERNGKVLNDYELSKKHFLIALDASKNTQPALQQVLYMEASISLAKSAKNKDEQTQALSYLEKAGSMQTQSSDWIVMPLFPLHIHQYYSIRGIAHAYIGNYSEAEYSLTFATNQLTQTSYQGLLGYNYIYTAEMHLKQEDYPNVSHDLQAALDIFQARQSQRGLYAVSQLIEELTLSPFGASTEAASLRIQIARC